ncbi:MAG TPA: hypothetical protein VFK48_12130 [Usitatibacter sp.]|nr:hypothetical protein [Usitatibacter sp.]
MNRHFRSALAAAALACACLPAAATEPLASCRIDPRATGIAERMENLRDQMDRIEWTADRNAQRHLMELHMKAMREGMRELRRREAGEGCRMEMMHAMMEQMMRHQIVLSDAGDSK